MPVVALVRVLRFSASHKYWRKDWTPDRNRAEFGDLSESHRHDFRIEVAVEGPPDPETGFVMELTALDALLAETLAPFRSGDLNEAIPEVREGKVLPSTEALAAWIWEKLEGRLPGETSLRRVKVWESEELGAEVVGFVDSGEGERL
jgi:6-pyruvoyltetrahydropterin/6-carboxytetrahydropterin synthase